MGSTDAGRPLQARTPTDRAAADPATGRTAANRTYIRCIMRWRISRRIM